MTELIPNQNGAIPISSRKMVRFAANIPIEIALLCPDGIRVEGRYGDRVKYALTDDRTMYVHPFVAERIKELDVQPGELFQICKRQATKGNRRTVSWLVQRGGEPETQLERDLRASPERAEAPEITQSALSALTSPAAAVAQTLPLSPFCELGPSASDDGPPKAHGERNGSGDLLASPARPPTDASTRPPPDTQLAHALKTAIAAAADAEKFAKTLDYNIRFTAEDVRSMGITVLIGMQQRTLR